LKYELIFAERISLFIGLIGLMGFALMPFNSGEIQTCWFVFFASYSIFATRIFTKPIQLERIGLLGFLGFLGFLGYIPGADFLHALFGLAGFSGFLGFSGRRPKLEKTI